MQTRKKKIFLVNLSIAEVIGGAESELPKAHLGLLSLAEHQRKLGNSVSVLDGDSGEKSDKEITDNLVSEYPLVVGFSPSQVNSEYCSSPSIPFFIQFHSSSFSSRYPLIF